MNLFENENGFVNFNRPVQNVYGKTFIEKYMDRSPKYESMNIDTYALKVDFKKGKEKHASKTVIKNAFVDFDLVTPQTHKTSLILNIVGII